MLGWLRIDPRPSLFVGLSGLAFREDLPRHRQLEPLALPCCLRLHGLLLSREEVQDSLGQMLLPLHLS